VGGYRYFLELNYSLEMCLLEIMVVVVNKRNIQYNYSDSLQVLSKREWAKRCTADRKLGKKDRQTETDRRTDK